MPDLDILLGDIHILVQTIKAVLSSGKKRLADSQLEDSQQESAHLVVPASQRRRLGRKTSAIDSQLEVEHQESHQDITEVRPKKRGRPPKRATALRNRPTSRQKVSPLEPE